MNVLGFNRINCMMKKGEKKLYDEERREEAGSTWRREWLHEEMRQVNVAVCTRIRFSQFIK